MIDAISQLVLVRHCSTSINEQGSLLGSRDPGLSELGLQQLAALTSYLESRNFDNPKLLSSPMTRAVETSSAISKSLDLEMKTSEALVERHLGPYEGLDANALREARKGQGLPLEDMTLIWEDADEVETDRSIFARVRHALDLEFSGEPEPVCAIVVSHAGLIKALSYRMLDMPARRPYGIRITLGSVMQFNRNGAYTELAAYWPNPLAGKRYIR